MEDKIIKAEKIVKLSKDIKELNDFKDGCDKLPFKYIKYRNLRIDGISLSISIDNQSKNSDFVLSQLNYIIDTLISNMKQELETLTL